MAVSSVEGIAEEQLEPLGLVSLGGCSIGILAAFGRLALGTIAGGGLAMGLIAVGGCAVGPYACGGEAIGKYATSGEERSLVAVQ